MTDQPTTPTASGRDFIRNLVFFLIVVVALWWLLLGRGSGSGSGGAVVDDPTPTPKPSVEYMLAAIDGDLSSEAEFGRILDRIQAGSAVCDPEPNREHVGDVLVASWQASAQRDTLLEWAQTAAAACGV